MPDQTRRHWLPIAILGSASFLAGALTPWVVAPPQAADEMGMQASANAMPGAALAVGSGSEEGSAPRGVIALGDGVMLQAKGCLKDRGIEVYDEPVTDPNRLQGIIATLSPTYGTIFVHVGNRDGLVDGHIDRALAGNTFGRRMIWATIQIPDPYAGEFSFEDRTNASIRNVVKSSENARLLDWNEATANHPDWLLDGMRPSTIGCDEYARKVAKLGGLDRDA